MQVLDYISVKGFKSIYHIEKLNLKPVNVLIGPNGSGKSNFISVFAFLNAVRSGRLQDYLGRAGGANNILHFGSKETEELTIRISFENEINQYEITLSATETDKLYPKLEFTYFWDKAKYSQPYHRQLVSGGGEAGICTDNSQIAKYIRDHLNKWRLYHFDDTGRLAPMKRTGDINDNRLFRSNGENIAAFLYYLKAKYRDCYQRIRDSVQLVAPFFGDFILNPQALNEDKIRLEWRHTNSDAYFDASAFSSGTLRFIALATLLLQPEHLRSSVILMDEPELGLHPYAISMLASLIKQASTDSQIIVATQSPLLLDHFEPEDVLVAERSNGKTNFTSLESPKLESWLEDFSLGQLWEKNEFGGRPNIE